MVLAQTPSWTWIWPVLAWVILVITSFLGGGGLVAAIVGVALLGTVFADEEAHAPPPADRTAVLSAILLLVSLVAIVGLAKILTPPVDLAMASLAVPLAVGGIIIVVSATRSFFTFTFPSSFGGFPLNATAPRGGRTAGRGGSHPRGARFPGPPTLDSRAPCPPVPPG